MKQLGNQDAGFIYNETPTTPMHIAGLGIYDQSTAPGGRLGHKDIIKYVQDRIHLAPIFRYKLVEVPLGLDKPYWIEDPDFDIEFHIRHIALPHPGDWRQLCILVSRINSRPIDFNRPLWEVYVIEGLDNIDGLPKGSFAILVKVHHSIVDGISGQGVFGALHDLARDAKPSVPDRPLTVERNPTNLELIARALPNLIKRPISQGRALYQQGPALLKNALKLYRGQLQSGAKLRVPTTRFNHYVSPHRVFDGTQFNIDDIKAIKNAVGQGTTLNDVMLTIIGGAMQKYLVHHKEKPNGSMSAMLPQDIRTEATRNHVGNLVGGLFADLHSDIEDPVGRLLAIHGTTNTAKNFAAEMNTAAIVQNYMGGFLTPPLGRALNRTIQRARLMERFGTMACNTLITNVPGPNFPLYHAGAQMVAYWGLPPVIDCLGMGHAIFSYCGKISVSAFGCRQMLPDPAFYMQCIHESYQQLFDAAAALQKQQQEARQVMKKRAAIAELATEAGVASATGNEAISDADRTANGDADNVVPIKPARRARKAKTSVQ
jgi:WS/DGAT/MGAT family acyltransferase